MTSTRLLDYLPRGNLLAGSAWRKRHNLALWISGLLAPALFVFALWLWRRPPSTLSGLLPLAGCTAMGAVFACVGLALFRRSTEGEQRNSVRLAAQLAGAEVAPRKFTSELLVNLARRNQSMLYRQLAIINQLQDKERDPDALGALLHLDHLVSRVRRNAESLLVLAAENPPRIWRKPVALVDVVRAAIAQTEDPGRIGFSVDERLVVLGHSVADLTHVLAELTENAMRFSPPEARVTVRTRRCPQPPGGIVLTIEDCGVGMCPEDLAHANELLRQPRDVDLSVSQRLGLHVVARLAARHGIAVSLSPTPVSGLTAVVTLPGELFADELVVGIPQPRGASSAGPTGQPARPPVVEGSSVPADSHQVASAVASPATGAQPSAHGLIAGQPLARRVPQASLAPQLRRPKPSGEVAGTDHG
ncbi:MAG TPA: sensor histidine kinase [Pseudonocardiaceae bacterium]